jgi:hypothetical protein
MPKAPDLPRGQALWRLNELGLLALRTEPGPAIDRQLALAGLDAAIENGWWNPDAPRWRKPPPERLQRWIEHRDAQRAAVALLGPHSRGKAA